MRKIKLKNPGKHVITLTKPGDEVEIIGIFETKRDEQVSVEIIIHHCAPRTLAITTLKGVVRDKSQLKFKGKIVIDPNCGQSNSFLTERILLLSDQAYVEAVPDLEIMTDDVKCSHAISISNINPQQLFYLMSRGLCKKQAQDLIIKGFLSK